MFAAAAAAVKPPGHQGRAAAAGLHKAGEPTAAAAAAAPRGGRLHSLLESSFSWIFNIIAYFEKLAASHELRQGGRYCCGRTSDQPNFHYQRTQAEGQVNIHNLMAGTAFLTTPHQNEARLSLPNTHAYAEPSRAAKTPRGAPAGTPGHIGNGTPGAIHATT